MDFIVPQFIERETKILGPFNFKQSIFLGVAGALCVFLYFFIKSLWLFLLVAFLLTVSALALVFMKVGGTAMPDVLKNFFAFATKPRIYLWQKKAIPPKIRKSAPPPKKEEQESSLKIVERSHLSKLHSILETKS